MSEYVGEAKVRIVPDASGFGAELRQQVGQQASSVGAGQSNAQQIKNMFASMRQTVNETDRLNNKIAVLESSQRRLSASTARSAAAFGILGFAARGLVQDFGEWAQQQDNVLAGLGKIASGVSSLDLKTTGEGIGEFAARARFGVEDVQGQLQGRASALRLSEQERVNVLAEQFLDLREKAAKQEGQVGTAAGRVKYQLEQQLRVIDAQLKRADPQQRKIAFGQLGTLDFGRTNPALATGGPKGPSDQDFQLRTLRAQTTKTQADDLALFRERAKFLQGLIGRIEESGVETEQAKSNLARLYGQLLSSQKQISAIEEQINAAKRESLQNSIALAQTQVSIQAANARTTGQEIAALQAEASLARDAATKKLLTVQERAGYELQAANAEKQIYQIQQQQAALAAQRAAEEKRQAEQLAAENAAKLQRQKDAYRSLVELRLSNAEAVAQLTKSTADDKKAIRKQIAYWKSRVAELTGLEREQARTELISARGRLSGLSTTSSGGSAADFFKQAISDFRSFGSNFSATGSNLSAQASRGGFAGMALGNASNAQLQKAYQAEANRLARIRTKESVTQTKLLGAIAGAVGVTGLKLPNNKVPGVGASLGVGLAGAFVNGS